MSRIDFAGPSLLGRAHLMVRREGALPLFVVYERPLDFPEIPCVVRLWKADKPTSIAWLFSSLETARAAIPSGLHRIPRSDADDSVIVETWL